MHGLVRRLFAACILAVMLWIGAGLALAQSSATQRPVSSGARNDAVAEFALSAGYFEFTGTDEVRSEYDPDKNLSLLQLQMDLYPLRRLGFGIRRLESNILTDGQFVYTDLHFGGFMTTLNWRVLMSEDSDDQFTLVAGRGTLHYRVEQAANGAGENFPAMLYEAYWTHRSNASRGMGGGVRIGIGRIRGEVGPVDTSLLTDPPPAGLRAPPLDAAVNGHYYFVTVVLMLSS